MIDTLRYQREDGREPFTEWLNSVRDKIAQARIRVRLRQLQAGNFGDCMPVGEGVMGQAADIKRAKELWSEWKRRQA